MALLLGFMAWLWVLHRRAVRRDQLIRVRSDIQSLNLSAQVYRAFNGFYPTTEQGFEALIRKPTTAPVPEHWRATLASPPDDPWGRPYVYRSPVRGRPDSFEVFSRGPDGREDTSDDVRNPPQPNPALERMPTGGNAGPESSVRPRQ